MNANDVYVRFIIGTDTQCTTTLDDGGSECEWDGGNGETLSFDCNVAGVPVMEVQAWDADVGTADDLIGSAVLNLRDRGADEPWTVDQWITLTRKGKESGSVHLKIGWTDDPPEPERRAISATVLAARDLPRGDVLGENDVYTEVSVSCGETSETFRTSVVDEGGSSPSWGESGEGEILEFYPKVTGIPVIQVKCFDQDVGSADDVLGTAMLNLKHHSPVESWQEESWFPLRKNGKDAGEVNLRIAWDCDPPQAKRRGIRVTIFAAKGLPKSDLLGQNDVYALATIGDASSRTSVIDGGGEAPDWGSGGDVLEFFPELCGIPTLELKLFDDDVGSTDDELGVALVNLRSKDPGEDFQHQAWFPLQGKGKDAAVHALIQWTADPPEPKRRRIRVTILAARGLYKADLLGQNDVYTQATIGDASSRTSVIDGGGEAPVWGSDGEGEVLEFFPEMRGIPTLELKLFDEDVGSADDELGVALVNLRAKDVDSAWFEKTWFPLKRKGKDEGAVHALIQWEPDPPEPKRRGVVVKVLQARNLPSMDSFGENDPYVVVSVDGTSQQTRTIDGGGEACSWQNDDGEGSLMQFGVETSSIPSIIISCLDDDGVGSTDDNIGSHVLHFFDKPTDEPWSLGLHEEEFWLPLKNSNHKLAGECQVSIEWIANPPEQTTRRLVVTVLDADGLPKQDRFGQNDPYCEVIAGELKRRTKTVEGGGTSPSWGFGSGDELEFILETAWVPTLSFNVFDEDVGSSDDHIGSCDLRPDHSSCDADSKWFRDEHLNLVNKHGHAAGRLHVRVEWEPHPEKFDTSSEMRAMGVTIFHAHVDPEHQNRGDHLYCTASAHGSNERTTVSPEAADGSANWGDMRPGHEHIEYLERQHDGLRPDLALPALQDAPKKVALPEPEPEPEPDGGADSTAVVAFLSDDNGEVTDADSDSQRDRATELWNFSQHLGIRCVDEPHLVWIAEEAIDCALPHGWEAVDQSDGTTYFAHRALGKTQWEHPLDPYLSALVQRARDSRGP